MASMVLRLLFLLVFATSAEVAQAGNPAGKRVAMVVGNSAYTSGTLINPKNDAIAMRDVFLRLGFDVEFKLDATRRDMDEMLRRFGKQSESAEVATLFYAGHGVQIAGENFLVPIGAAPENERDVKREMVRLGDIIDEMGNARIKIVFFDACRDNPLTRSFTRGGSRGLAAPKEDTSGTLISFATKHGQTASDGEGRHSPYTTSLLEEIEKSDAEIEQMLRRVQQGVRKTTKGGQEPWRYGSLDGDYYFVPPSKKAPAAEMIAKPAAPAADPAALELELWQSARQLNTETAYQSYLAKYASGQFSDLARETIRTIRDAQPPKMQGVAAADPGVTTATKEDLFWAEIEASKDAGGYAAYLNRYPNGKYADQAVQRQRVLAERSAGERKARDQDMWTIAEATNTKDGYARYLQAFPSGQYANAAQLRVARLTQSGPTASATGVKEFVPAESSAGEEFPKALRRIFRQK